MGIVEGREIIWLSEEVNSQEDDMGFSIRVGSLFLDVLSYLAHVGFKVKWGTIKALRKSAVTRFKL